MTNHSVTFSRDNLVQLVLRPDFYEKLPELESHREALTDCIGKFRESGRKAGCGCRADASFLFGCMENMLVAIEGWKETAPERICDFVKYATNITPTANEVVSLGVFFRRSGADGDVIRYSYKCPQP